MPNAPKYLLFALLLAALAGCATDPFAGENVTEILFADSIRNITHGYYRAHYAVEDTARWRVIMEKADTVAAHPSGLLSGDERKFRSDGIWYEVKLVDGEWRSRQHYPGFERVIDSLPREDHIMVLPNDQRVRVIIPAADVVLGGDSVRIGIIHTTGPAYDWNYVPYESQPDQIIITTPGRDTFPIALDMECVGPVSNKTVFRVGKRQYLLRSIARDYRGILIKELEPGRPLPLAAELDLKYKPVGVKTLDGEPTSIKRTPGKELVLFFWDGYRNRPVIGNRPIIALDSLYYALPEAARAGLDVAVITSNSVDTVRNFFARNNLRIPVFQKTEKTCLRLNCSPYRPYYLSVNKQGRITSFHDWPIRLKEKLEVMSEPTASRVSADESLTPPFDRK